MQQLHTLKQKKHPSGLTSIQSSALKQKVALDNSMPEALSVFANTMHANPTHPFLSNTMPLDWSRLTPQTAQIDIPYAIAEVKTRLATIAELPQAAWSFENVVYAIDAANTIVNNAWDKLWDLSRTCNTPAQRAAYNALLPQVVELRSQVPLDAKLWQVLKGTAVKLKAEQTLSATDAYILEDMLADFRDAGADLAPTKQARLVRLSMELSKLTQQFADTVQDSLKAWTLLIEDATELQGIPENVQNILLQNAIDKGLATPEHPKYLINLTESIRQAVLTYAHDPVLRETVWQAAMQIGRQSKHDTRPLIPKILALRQEQAELFGQPNFSALVLRRRMAGTPEKALAFVEDLHEKLQEPYEQVLEQLATQKGFPLEPWDVAYYGEKFRQSHYKINDEALRAYFPLEQVISGMFKVAETLFNIKIKEVLLKPNERWHEEVHLFEVLSNTDDLLGHFYTDYHSRPEKVSGAWMCFVTAADHQNARTGSLKPVAMILTNFTRPTSTAPALLTHQETNVIFHEFGHTLHVILSQADIRCFDGINLVAWDYIETPSQFMENFCWERDSLDIFARHYQTGQPLPEALLQSLQKSRRITAILDTARRLAISKMDLELHLHPGKFQIEDPQQLDEAIDATINAYMPHLQTPTPNAAPSLIHLFWTNVGYASGFYSYQWAQVLEADAFSRFQSEGILNAATGKDWKEKVLAKGTSTNPAELMRNFLGREPTSEAFLSRNFLNTPILTSTLA